MSIIQGNAKQASTRGFYDFPIEQSLRFNDDDSAYLSWTPASAGNRKTWTWSGWVKLGDLAQNMNIFGAGTDSTPSGDEIRLAYQSNKFRVNGDNTSGLSIIPTAVHRDPSAWYHVVYAHDTTQATASNRAKLYINGQLITDLAVGTYPAQNREYGVNSTDPHKMGQRPRDATEHFDGYLAEVHFCDGEAYTADAFGELKSGVWVAKAPSVTYGTNGFHLDFANSADIGNDVSGEGNDWTPNNFTASDVVLDSPTDNFATLNPLWNSVQQTYADGNLQATSGSSHSPAVSTIGVSSGKWYVEGKALSSSTNKWSAGILDTAINYRKISGTNYIPGQNPTSVYSDGDAINYYTSGNDIYKNGSQVVSNAFSSALTTNDVIQIAFDVDSGEIWYGINNSWNNGTGTQGTFDPDSPDTTFTVQESMLVHFTGENNVWLANFGQSDFAYTPPDGFLALSTANLPDPVIDPAQGSSPEDYFNTVLYTGTGSAVDINTVGFQPDWVWGKKRSAPNQNNWLIDSVRGAGVWLASDGTGSEGTEPAGSSFDADGFNTNSNSLFTYNGGSYVLWSWKAGGTAASNTDGSIPSTVSANTTSGFSIVSYSGNSTAGATIGHGLTSAPEMVIFKNRDGAYGWPIYHESLGATQLIYLNLTNAAVTSDAHVNNTAPTSSVITLHDHVLTNVSPNDYIAYCFHSVEGFSKFGSYTGNGSADGPFVYTGFRPAFVLFKKTNITTASWAIRDNTRYTYNPTRNTLYADKSDAEYTGTAHDVDFLSNGFKPRTTDGLFNSSGATYIYMAFAENPFKFSTAS